MHDVGANLFVWASATKQMLCNSPFAITDQDVDMEKSDFLDIQVYMTNVENIA
jgi:hypothetical protein